MRDDAVGSIPGDLQMELRAGDTQVHSSSEAENGFPSPKYCRLEHLYSTAVCLSLTLVSLKGLSELMIPGFEFCHWMIHTEHRSQKSSNMHSKCKYWTPNRSTKKMNTACIHGEIGISRSEVRGKKPQTKTKTQHYIKDPPLTKVVRTCYNYVLQQHWV